MLIPQQRTTPPATTAQACARRAGRHTERAAQVAHRRWRGDGDVCEVPELAVDGEPPAPHGAARLDCAGVAVSGGDADRAGTQRLDSGLRAADPAVAELALVVVARADDCAGALERAGVRGADHQRHGVGRAVRSSGARTNSPSTAPFRRRAAHR